MKQLIGGNCPPLSKHFRFQRTHVVGQYFVHLLESVLEEVYKILINKGHPLQTSKPVIIRVTSCLIKFRIQVCSKFLFHFHLLIAMLVLIMFKHNFCLITIYVNKLKTFNNASLFTNVIKINLRINILNSLFKSIRTTIPWRDIFPRAYKYY